MIGIDTISILRIKKILSNKNKTKYFLKKIFTKNEIKAIKLLKNKSRQNENIAGYYASKEALSKALGVGIGKHFSFLDAKIKKNKLGKPYFKVNKKIKKYFKIKSRDISLSISHDGNMAISVVFIKA